jgi:hypothetical protein
VALNTIIPNPIYCNSHGISTVDKQRFFKKKDWFVCLPVLDAKNFF